MLKKINISEYQALVAHGKVLEFDGGTPKVILLPGDRILKLFRRKRLLSSQLWITYATRFARNASKLQRRGIPTIQVISTFRIPKIRRQAVLYERLPGETLRDWLTANSPEANFAKCQEFGIFTAEPHRRGILFRSIHFGNILVQPDGSFGLIDVADIQFNLRASLSLNQRLRSLHHMDRHAPDRCDLAAPAGSAYLEAYLAVAKLSEKANHAMRTGFEATFAHYRPQ
jgi:Ser/Thr protein kinase RdoA (MazF antagonist)